MSKTDKSAATATAPEVVEVEIVMDSVADLASLVNDAFENESGKAPQRGFTKNGFNSAEALEKLNTLTLSTMAGCIIQSLSNQITDEDESPLAALNIISEYAQNVGTMTANTAKLSSYVAIAIDVGYGSAIGQDNPDIDTLTLPQMAKIGMAFLNAQKGAKVDAEFQAWATDLAATA